MRYVGGFLYVHLVGVVAGGFLGCYDKTMGKYGLNFLFMSKKIVLISGPC